MVPLHMNEYNNRTAILNQARSLPIPASSLAGHFIIFHLCHDIWGCISEATLNFSLRPNRYRHIPEEEMHQFHKLSAKIM